MVEEAQKLSGYLTVKAAAQLLGVSCGTLRNWDKARKLVPLRHPVNGYRLYRRFELEKMLAGVNSSRNQV